MTNPLIQIDDEIREMTDEEYKQHLLNIKDSEQNYVGIVANPFPSAVADEPVAEEFEPVDEE
jgi:hypothetical protein